ncbi:MAG: hypothetical protein M1360_02665 [Candidatus Marsarchaeota archaeon]|jgi:MFS family permease|nr:hypothetical protein [Candidatus Marsarchaeota archaeon]MCL5418820.1 hypothetical protein [Candidatus Marsarchaeota archaeon]
MKYAREHIKRYWIFEYRRALGISMVTFAIALSVGMVFTTLINAFAIPNPVYELAFWGLLILFTSLVLVSSFVNAHILSVKYMNDMERTRHSKYMGGWLTILAIGAIAFVIPLIFFTNVYEPVAILFGFGGVFLVLFLSVKYLFNYSYYEIAIGVAALWVVAIITAIGAYTYSTPSNTVALGSFSLFVSVLSLIIITGFIGMSLLVNATNEFSHEFRLVAQNLERQQSAAKARSRRTRR